MTNCMLQVQKINSNTVWENQEKVAFRARVSHPGGPGVVSETPSTKKYICHICVNECTSIYTPRNNVSLRVCPIIDHHLIYVRSMRIKCRKFGNWSQVFVLLLSLDACFYASNCMDLG